MVKKWFLWLLFGMTTALANPGQLVEVQVQIDGEVVRVDLNMLVPATQSQVWSVLTDYEHMAGFVSNLKQSKVLNVSGNTLKIFQSGQASYGALNFSFESTREVQLTPYEKIHSRLLSGNMRRFEGRTELYQEGSQTRVVYHSESIPGVWIPPVIGKIFIEHESREQFQELRDEIIRRLPTPPAQP